MDNEIYKQIILSYVPYGVQVQYEGILNGKEKSTYKKEHNAQCKKIDAKGGSYNDYPEYNMPKDVIGLKLGLIKRVSFWKNYIKLEIGIKGLGLKKFYLNTNSNADFKLVLRPLTDLTNPKNKDVLIDLSDNSRFLISDFFSRGKYYPSLMGLKMIDYNILVKRHYDIFGLIEEGLAVNINTLNLSTKN